MQRLYSIPAIYFLNRSRSIERKCNFVIDRLMQFMIVKKKKNREICKRNYVQGMVNRECNIGGETQRVIYRRHCGHISYIHAFYAEPREATIIFKDFFLWNPFAGKLEFKVNCENISRKNTSILICLLRAFLEVESS